MSEEPTYGKEMIGDEGESGVTIHQQQQLEPEAVAPLEIITPGTASAEEKTEIRFRGRVLSLTGENWKRKKLLPDI